MKTLVSYDEFYNLKPGTKVYDKYGNMYIAMKDVDTYHTYGMMVSVDHGTLHHHTEFGEIWTDENN